jgi:methionine sulfoxide reductase heme-binding subunit
MGLWFTARGAGLAALVALTAATTLGALGSVSSGASIASRDVRHASRRVVVQYAHRAAATLGLALLALHVTSIVVDAKSNVSLLGALLPFTAGYRPEWVGLGTVTLYLVITVSVLGAARGRLATSDRAVPIWRGLHALSYAAWALAIVHGFEAGSDLGLRWVDLIFLGCIAAVLMAATVRLASVLRGDVFRRAMEPAR